jgi:UDP-glucose 4-epimerase
MHPNWIDKRVLVTGGSGYIGSYFTAPQLPLYSFSSCLGSHVIYVLQKTRRYKVISLDNNHNSNPAALDRVSQLSKSELPAHPTDSERESTEIDSRKCDLTQPDQIRAVFETYGKEGIWGVIHIAVSLE